MSPRFWSWSGGHHGIVLFSIAALGAALYALGVVRHIPNNRIGIVERLWSPKGSVKHGLLALDGEAGFQPDLLRGGLTHDILPRRCLQQGATERPVTARS